MTTTIGEAVSEHTGCPLVADMRVNSRTTLTNRAMQRLAWNMPFHTAHHVYPGVPFHDLAGGAWADPG